MPQRCAGIRLAQYTDTWICHKHNESRRTTHTDKTPPPPSHTMASACPPTPSNTTASKTQTHIPLSPCPSRIGESTHPNTSYPTRAKHIHIMSHTPFTTLISSMSHALGNTPNPQVPPIYALTANTPPHDPTLHTAALFSIPFKCTLYLLYTTRGVFICRINYRHFIVI